MNQPNGIVMANAIKAEMIAAEKENRICSSSKAIEIFRQNSKPKLSTEDENELFDIVFEMIHEITGGKLCNDISKF